MILTNLLSKLKCYKNLCPTAHFDMFVVERCDEWIHTHIRLSKVLMYWSFFNGMCLRQYINLILLYFSDIINQIFNPSTAHYYKWVPVYSVISPPPTVQHCMQVVDQKTATKNYLFFLPSLLSSKVDISTTLIWHKSSAFCTMKWDML